MNCFISRVLYMLNKETRININAKLKIAPRDPEVKIPTTEIKQTINNETKLILFILKRNTEIKNRNAHDLP